MLLVSVERSTSLVLDFSLQTCKGFLSESRLRVLKTRLIETSLMCRFLPGKEVGYAVGGSGTLFKTEDNGITWKRDRYAANSETRNLSSWGAGGLFILSAMLGPLRPFGGAQKRPVLSGTMQCTLFCLPCCAYLHASLLVGFGYVRILPPFCCLCAPWQMGNLDTGGAGPLMVWRATSMLSSLRPAATVSSWAMTASSCATSELEGSVDLREICTAS